MVFSDAAGAINDTISRAHAHIDRLANGEYRLFDDRSAGVMAAVLLVIAVTTLMVTTGLSRRVSPRRG